MRFSRALVCLLIAALSLPAAASFHTFALQQYYSNADGSIQFIVLTEMAMMNNQELLAGRVITSRQGATTHTLIFDKNLPSTVTANSSFLIATPGFVALGLITPDYVMPAGFLFTNGGTVNYAAVDQGTYVALPTDGVNALRSDGTIGPNLATNFAGASASVTTAPPTVAVIEYYNNVLDHYFMTPLAAEIALLDAHAPPFQDWARTQQSFQAHLSQAVPTVGPVCRFLIPPAHGDSHFFSAQPADCAFLLAAAADPVNNPNFSGYIQETPAEFFVTLPDATGACPGGTVPVFRLWNQRFDSNHRYTTSAAVVAQMKARNYVQEGAAPNLAVMCVAP